MNISILTLGQLNTNCFLLIDELTQQCLIIDPADEPELISEEILRQDLQPLLILATHGHFDHIMAASALQMNFDLDFLIHRQDEFLVRQMNQSIKYWLHQESALAPPTVTGYLTDGQTIALGEHQVQVISVPGHTPGSVCFFSAQEKKAFTGDTLFVDGVGRTDFSYSLPSQMEHSLAKIKRELAGYQAYAGHGQEFFIA